jgi:hypothetical protein
VRQLRSISVHERHGIRIRSARPSGCGWAQVEGGPREEVRQGDIVWFPPGVKHWHGATATIGMSHIAISEALEGKTVDWLEKVTNAQFGT